jgi:opacity protein-like surface antigen
MRRVHCEYRTGAVGEWVRDWSFDREGDDAQRASIQGIDSGGRRGVSRAWIETKFGLEWRLDRGSRARSEWGIGQMPRTNPKTLLLLMLALTVELAFAGLATAESESQYAFDGVYIGGEAFYSHHRFKVDSLRESSQNLDGGGGGAILGWGFATGPVYGSLEANFGYDGAGDSAVTFGVSYRLGGILAERYLIYMRMGWQRIRVEPSSGGDQEFDGFRVGGGVDVMLYSRLSLLLEYTYTIYPDPYSASDLDVEIRQNRFSAGPLYRFF